jgi:hypothetical protein
MTTRQSQLISPIESYASCNSDLPVLCAASNSPSPRFSRGEGKGEGQNLIGSRRPSSACWHLLPVKNGEKTTCRNDGEYHKFETRSRA